MLLCLMLSLQEKYSFCSNVWISRKCTDFCRESQKKCPLLVQVCGCADVMTDLGNGLASAVNPGNGSTSKLYPFKTFAKAKTQAAKACKSVSQKCSKKVLPRKPHYIPKGLFRAVRHEGSAKAFLEEPTPAKAKCAVAKATSWYCLFHKIFRHRSHVT